MNKNPKVIGTKREEIFQGSKFKRGIRDKLFAEYWLVCPRRLFTLETTFPLKLSKTVKKNMYTAITRFPLLTIKNYITESRLLNKVEVNSIEIKLEMNFFRQNLYAPLAGRINYIAVKCFVFFSQN